MTAIRKYTPLCASKSRVIIGTFCGIVLALTGACASKTASSEPQGGQVVISDVSYIWEITNQSGKMTHITVDLVRRDGQKWVRERPSIVQPKEDLRVQSAIQITLQNGLGSPVRAEFYVGVVRDDRRGLEVTMTDPERYPVGATEVRIPIGSPVPGDQASANKSMPVGGIISLTRIGGS